jgi:hypothetical protein
MDRFGALSQRGPTKFAAAQFDCRRNVLIDTEQLRP